MSEHSVIQNPTLKYAAKGGWKRVPSSAMLLDELFRALLKELMTGRRRGPYIN